MTAARIAGPRATSYPAGVEAVHCEPGDFILTHTHGVGGALIRWGQRIRFRGQDRLYAQWNHAALIVSTAGDLVEALTRTGATRSHLAKYAHVEYTLVRSYATVIDQGQIMDFAERIVGEGYGWTNDAAAFLAFLTGWGLTVSMKGQIMCSELVARALERKGDYYDLPTCRISPAALARYHDVRITL